MTTSRSPASGEALQDGEGARSLYVYSSGREMAEGARFLAAEATVRRRVHTECLQKAGFHVPFVSIDESQLGWFDNELFPDIERMRRTSQFIPGGPNGTGGMTDVRRPPGAPGSVATSDRQKALDAAGNRCEKLLEPLDRVAADWQAIRSQWILAVQKVQTSPPVVSERAKYTRCLVSKGVPSRDAQTFAAFTSYADGQLISAGGDAGRVRVDSWLAQTFVTCAAGTVQVQERLQADVERRFVQAHLPELRRLEEQGTAALARVQAAPG